MATMYGNTRPSRPPEPPPSRSGGLPVSPGDVIAGKYEVQRVLGAGGCGVVVAARHLALGESVAVKILQKSAMRSPETVERFSREARAAARLRSEHVARVTDFGATDAGVPYMVMECLDGEDLGATLARDGKLPLSDAVDYVLMACDAVAEAHALGIVHRDLKPANLFLTRAPDGRSMVKVLDFGIARLLAAGDWEIGASVTQTQAVIGSPLYMSPEQMEASRDVDARADVWALGTILYQLIAGAPPFEAPTVPLLYVKVLSGERPTLLSERRDGVPGELAAIVDRCLSRDPADRFPTVGHLARELAAFASAEVAPLGERIARLAGAEELREGPPSGVRRRSLPSIDDGAASSRRPVTSTPPPPAKSPGVGLALAVVVAIGLGFGALGFAAGRREPPPAPAARAASRVAAAADLAARGVRVELASRATPDGAPSVLAEAAAPLDAPAASAGGEPSAVPSSPSGRPPRAAQKPPRPVDVLDER